MRRLATILAALALCLPPVPARADSTGQAAGSVGRARLGSRVAGAWANYRHRRAAVRTAKAEARAQAAAARLAAGGSYGSVRAQASGGSYGSRLRAGGGSWGR